MRRIARRALLVGALAVASSLSFGGSSSWAADFPTKPIKLIIPYPPGGGSDAVAAVFVDKLGQKLGQPVIRENHPGSNSVIGTTLLTQAEPDGHTLLVVTGAIASNPALYANLPYKTPDAFTPISILTSFPFALGVRSDLPVNSVKELVDYAKANPGKLTAGTSGRGSTAQLALGLFTKSAGIQIREIPFKGSGEALNSVAGKFVDMVFSGYETVRPFVESGKMRFLAHTGSEPLGTEKIPPILAEVPGAEYYTWLALIGPAGMPQEVTDKLNGAIKEIFAEQEVKNRLAAQNIRGIASSPAEAKDYLVKEMATSKAIAESIGLKPE